VALNNHASGLRTVVRSPELTSAALDPGWRRAL
jgi:hypothetical protein